MDSKPTFVPPIIKPAPEPIINSGKLLREWQAQTEPEHLSRFAQCLGVTVLSLSLLGCCWCRDSRAWGFGMRDGYGELIGIRLRSESGKKWAVPGSHNGIFIPQTTPQETGYVVEGPTDVAAALTLGVYAIGRPSCSGGMDHVLTAFRQLSISRAVLVADNDDPGLRGATMLASHFQIPACIFVPPAKDLREFVKLGGSAQLLNSIVDRLTWRVPDKDHHLKA